MSAGKGSTLVIPTERTQRRPSAVYADINEVWVTLEDLYIELGAALSEARRARRLSQADVAEAIGITRDQVALVETGKRWKQDSAYIERMAQYLSD